MTYQDQIKSPKWQKKRLEILDYNKYKCEECQDTEKQLHVHHAYYKKNHKIWEYENYELRCLCETCHTRTHDLNNKILHSLGIMEVVASLGEKERVLGYIQGLLGRSRETEPSIDFQQGFVDGMVNTDIEERYRLFASLYYGGK